MKTTNSKRAYWIGNERRRGVGVICLATLLMFSGCSQMTSQWNLKDWKTPNLVPEKKVEQVLPGRVMAIWTDAIHHKQGESAKRGFGGRIVFYNESESEPIQVEGTLTVYAFVDDEGNQSTKPEKKFVIRPEQLTQHFSRCSLGDSYSIWIPWDEVGGLSHQISLITRFDGVNGGTVLSEPARKLLPGRNAAIQADQNSPIESNLDGYQLEPIGSAKPIKNLFYEESDDVESGKVSLASFVAQDAGYTSQSTGNQERVQTVDLNSATTNVNSQTMNIPTALGLRSFNNLASQPIQPATNTNHLVEGFESQAESRVEKQAGATVFYGKPGQSLAERDRVLSEATGSQAEDRFQNYQADSIRLRQDQLQQVKDSRQQFRSEPWRFPVRTQAITRPTRSDVD